jgi:sulfoxide reductase heme-binding subunit YedZ
MADKSILTSRKLWKPIVFVLCLVPVAVLVSDLFADRLGPNPVEALNRGLGDWALRFLVVALAVRPVAEVTGIKQIVAYRRMIGLYAFFYVALHVVSYLVIDLQLDWVAFGKDILKRNYITVGMTAAVLLIPLAATSTKGMIKRLGGRAWRRLHVAVYVIVPLGVFHFFMMTKADFREPAIYGAIVAVLLGYRLWVRLRRDRRRSRSRAGRPAEASAG